VLILLLPEQIAEKWNALAPDIEAGLPPIVGRDCDMNSILNASLTGTLQLWLVKNEEQESAGLIITTIDYDIASCTKMLLIYTTTMYKGAKLNDFKSAFETLDTFARSKDCGGIMGYSNNETIIKYMKQLGCEVDQKLVMWRLK